ncbi:hypothetical protein KY332_03855 [Candidatus Woesearchaeota archaeon]|nr:hypothetical protein [Candidatus Woesearchaeota archaeon]
MAKKKKGDMKKAGHYSFLAGIILAVVVAFVPQLRGDITVWVLVTLGVVVGLMNVTAEETTKFLVAILALILASSASALTLATIWTGLTSILGNIIIFVSPAAIVVALKTVIALAED